MRSGWVHCIMIMMVVVVVVDEHCWWCTRAMSFILCGMEGWTHSIPHRMKDEWIELINTSNYKGPHPMNTTAFVWCRWRRGWCDAQENLAKIGLNFLRKHVMRVDYKWKNCGSTCTSPSTSWCSQLAFKIKCWRIMQGWLGRHATPDNQQQQEETQMQVGVIPLSITVITLLHIHISPLPTLSAILPPPLLSPPSFQL